METQNTPQCKHKTHHSSINPLTPELNPSAQRCLPRFLLGILNIKGLTARRVYKSFGVKGLKSCNKGIKMNF
jgi:hypothetical protein